MVIYRVQRGTRSSSLVFWNPRNQLCHVISAVCRVDGILKSPFPPLAPAPAGVTSDTYTQSLYNDLLEHNREWQTDRSVALSLMRDQYNPDTATALYENDDKCGSHWCKMPVCESGRDSKRSDKAKYDLAIQANVVCGEGGVARFAVVPSNVQTGANFEPGDSLVAHVEEWKTEADTPHRWRR